MGIISTDSKKALVIKLLREGKNIREISKVAHMSFSEIGKISREDKGIVEPTPQKSIASRAFELLEKGMSLIEVAIELDIDPERAENIQQSYLKLKGLNEIAKYCQRVKKNLPSFMEFVYICEEHTPESQKLLDIFNLEKVIDGQKQEHINLNISNFHQQQKLDKLREEEDAIKQRIEKLKQEEYNQWYEVFGNGKYNSIDQD